MLLARYEADAMQAAVFGVIPMCVGIGYFIDAALVRREMHPSAYAPRDRKQPRQGGTNWGDAHRSSVGAS